MSIDAEAGNETGDDDLRELGDAVAFLSSARASFITETALPVDGGALQS